MHNHQSPIQGALEAGFSRRRLLTRLVALLAALGIAFAAAPGPAASKDKKKRKRRGGNGKGKGNGKGNRKQGNGGGGYAPDGEERAFLDLINDYRRRNGAGDLALQDQLGAAAEHHSRDMAKKNYFKHTLANGDSPEENIERFGYTGWNRIGENIAAGFETARQVMEGWQNSPDRDKNMRNKEFTEIGIGRAYAKDSKYGWYWTTTFGRR
jgi:uncharacterized protein YkwD